MDSSIAWKGTVLGFSIAAPVGPIGLLCIRRTLAQGTLAGFTSGLGAAAADLAYGFVAAFGLTAVSGLLVSHSTWIRIIGGLFLCYLGVSTFRSTPATDAPDAPRRNLFLSFGSTFLLTLTNPMTILSFLAMFAGLGLASSAASNYRDGACLVAGVFLGSALWWLLLSGITGMVRHRFTSGAMRWVNRLSGLLIFSFGLAALLRR
jgi:threonine/homoserine/homoserine lactone efflux protein